jgi:hypothetical protein
MNRITTIIGVGLVVLGLVLSFVPLFEGPSQELTPSRSVAVFNATAVISLSPDLTVDLSWTSNEAVSLLVVVCHSINLSASSLQTVCPGASLTVLNGTTGSGSFSVPVGGNLLVGLISNPGPGARVEVQLKPTLALAGAILVLGGAGVTIVGLLPRRKKPPAPAPDPAPGEEPAG